MTISSHYFCNLTDFQLLKIHQVSSMINKYFLPILISLCTLLFISCGTESTPVYNLTTSVNGERTITPSSGEYEEGETITLTGTPSEHWVFQNWSGDGSGSSNTITITMDSDKNVVGNFTERLYPLNITFDGEGTVDEVVIQSKSEYTLGTVVELTSKPKDGWVFYGWKGDLEGNDNPQTLEIDNDKNVTSVFKTIDELLTIEISGEGTVDIQQESIEDNPSRRTVTLTPNPSTHWEFVEWGGDLSGEEVTKSITLTNEKRVTVKFTTPVFLGKNGITIMCPDGEVGDIGIVDGKEYEVADRELLLQRLEEGRGSLSRKVCVSLITDMNRLFVGLNFDEPIGNWDVSNVTNMFRMFYETSFNQNIKNWDVSNVTDMGQMFIDTPFNEPIGDWDVSSVTNMRSMFPDTPFNQPIGDWDVSNVTDMRDMFLSSQFNQNISDWCVWRIGTEPNNFSSNSPLTEDNKPVWGTCPD